MDQPDHMDHLDQLGPHGPHKPSGPPGSPRSHGPPGPPRPHLPTICKKKLSLPYFRFQEPHSLLSLVYLVFSYEPYSLSVKISSHKALLAKFPYNPVMGPLLLSLRVFIGDISYYGGGGLPNLRLFWTICLLGVISSSCVVHSPSSSFLSTI